MNNEKILYYLGILENGALNYYQTIETIRIASQSIQDYIEQLEEQVKKQKEVIGKATNDLQKLIDNINDKTIISFGQFVTKLEIIQDELGWSNDILKEVKE